LGGVLTGYAGWQAEGHERRVADTVVDGACALVRATLESADLDLARWALSQARKVEPYSESLTRAAMRIAAASGDARRLLGEWQECRRQMDELDPGGTPSEGTERLYVALRAQLHAQCAGGPPGGIGQASFAAIDAAPRKRVPSAPSTV
ncbi:MAG: bacterial transcriptional activator domain-containing protein, partial [Solirubrobacteraceae bacterium]